MSTQVIQDDNGKPTGVYIPIKDWEKIKMLYPGIEQFDDDLPQWEKELIDQRLATIAENPEKLQPIESLFAELKREI
ncbi:addiction module protein [Galbibacter sp. EGI 63066]|uniref:addiction module protein n=1 Tax=Galbibacter sp. EGI 63066 TaxID=2993559 RepID=UPI0022495396|nr:addiction module protein [Galbibacter sp. EGI 63066]MCX2681428.1 addiction module protein [Galbibacter sp. EGI 63066]